MQYETITMPDAGIGSFLTSNMDEIDDNILMFGHGGGINSIKEVADRMASMGRNGDNYIVHATEQEVIIPRDVVENNPQLINQVKDAIAADGTDPERYVVGSSSNSINPLTGQPEFFKFLKNIVKKVKKVFKKAAKIILPVAAVALTGGLGGAGLFGMGAAGTAALASGVGSLIQGESFKDALKSAAIAGLGTGLVGGLTGGFKAIASGSGTFGSGFAQGAIGTLPGGLRTGAEKLFGVGQAAQAAPEITKLSQLNSGQLDFATKLKALSPDLGEKALVDAALNAVPGGAAAAGGKSSLLGTAFKYGLPSLLAAGAAGAFDPIPTEEITEVAGIDVTDQTDAANPIASTTSVLDANEGAYRVGVPSAPTFFDFNQIMVPSAALYGPSQGTIANLYANLTPVGAGTNVITPSATASGEAPAETEVAEVVIPGYDPTVTGMRPAPLYGVDAQGNPVFTPYYSDPILPAAYAASGGAMNRQGQRNMALEQFPRRTGQIEGPGTETSDDIPAMLSDGEFVMTAKAVKGAGNGSREQGFKKMYDIMRSFEGGAVA